MDGNIPEVTKMHAAVGLSLSLSLSRFVGYTNAATLTLSLEDAMYNKVELYLSLSLSLSLSLYVTYRL